MKIWRTPKDFSRTPGWELLAQNIFRSLIDFSVKKTERNVK